VEQSGVRFTCQPGCTNCCRNQGHVYLTEEDLARAAAFLGMSRLEFELRFVYRTRHLRRLRKPRGTTCRFLEQGGCAIHPAKPSQCRLFPFWPELVEISGAWEKTASWCPGIGQGPLIRIRTAVETAREMCRAYPTMYEFVKLRRAGPNGRAT